MNAHGGFRSRVPAYNFVELSWRPQRCCVVNALFLESRSNEQNIDGSFAGAWLGKDVDALAQAVGAQR